MKTPDRIIESLSRDRHLSMAEIAAGIGLSVRAVEMACAKLVESGRIRRIGPNNGGHWEVLPDKSRAAPSPNL